MKLEKHGTVAYIVEGLGQETLNGICVIEWKAPRGDEIVLVNGASFKMKEGKRGIPATCFRSNENEFKVFSGGVWYPIYGIVNQENRLVYSDNYMREKLTTLLIERITITQKYEECKKALEELQRLCSGGNYL